MIKSYAQSIPVAIDGDKIYIGEEPQLVVDLIKQDNYIKLRGREIAYRREVKFSADLLSGKRENVRNTAIAYYYRQACETAKGIEAAEGYRGKVNRTIREKK